MRPDGSSRAGDDGPSRDDGGSLWFARLADLVDGRLTADDAQAVEHEAGSDPRQAAALAWLRGFRRAAATAVIADPPAQVRAALLRGFADARADSRAQAAPAGPRIVQRLRASLSFDGWGGPALGGLRGVEAAPSDRQMVYSTAPADVAIDLIAVDGGLVQVAGQVFPDDDDSVPGTARLERAGQTLGVASCNDLGEFAFEPVSRTPLTVVVTLGAVELVLDLDPGAAGGR